MPTVEKNSYVHWLGYCISFSSTSSNEQHSTKIPDYNIANFDVLKLPVLEVRFYIKGPYKDLKGLIRL